MKNRDLYFEKLLELLKNAYVPYSRFRVSCLIMSDGGWFAGVNIENCAYSPSICAERSAVSSMVTAGFKNICQVYLLTNTLNKEVGTPCGVCRQVLSEFAKPNVPVIAYNLKGEKKVYKIGELLPFSFNVDSMN
ncbi:cytidine deaminase [Mycoplasmoides alvi]|uniref:cytidine deaminase n=1 Tax=Mycoplasmoides alvi TaxID=78580 RepID=UPI00051AB6F2|nr:cytidine deaminase [Mycoplasmoides alvi]